MKVLRIILAAWRDAAWRAFWRRQARHLPHTVLIHGVTVNGKDAPPGFIGIQIGDLPGRDRQLVVKDNRP